MKIDADADADAGGADEDDDAAVEDDPDAAAAAAASTSIPLIAGGRIGSDSVSLRRRFLFSSSSSFESDLGMQRASEIERRSRGDRSSSSSSSSGVVLRRLFMGSN